MQSADWALLRLRELGVGVWQFVCGVWWAEEGTLPHLAGRPGIQRDTTFAEGSSVDRDTRAHEMLAVVLASASAYTVPSAAKAPQNAFQLLDGVSVLRVTDGAAVALNQQWSADERCALFFFRSYG